MKELIERADLIDGILSKRNVVKYSYTVSQSEKHELNVENGEFKLLRTVFGGSAGVRVFEGARVGSAGGNDVTPEGLEQIVSDAILAAESAPEDPCHDIAPDQGKDEFTQGILEPDIDRFIGRIKELLDTIAKDYPTVNVMAATGSFDKSYWLSRNSNGTEFSGNSGDYGFSFEICASDGEKTSGLDYSGFSLTDLDKPFIECASIRRHLEDISKSIAPDPLEGKFTGTVVFTPESAEDFISMLLGNYAGERVVIDETSLWLDKVGSKVADEKLTVTFDPFDERILIGERATGDGFRSEKVTIIDKGILKTFMLSLYGANKTGRPLIKNTSFDLVIEPGDKSIDEIIASIDKGLVLGSFSGGQPGTNGEFSGVAKNSFLIENGKITKAVTETMVNGNLGEAFLNIRGISKELLCSGGSVVPYIAVDGIVISGK